MSLWQELATSVPLTVMTYNVGNGLADPARLASLLRQMAADVVGLQELAAPQAEILATNQAEMFPIRFCCQQASPVRGCSAAT